MQETGRNPGGKNLLEGKDLSGRLNRSYPLLTWGKCEVIIAL